MPVEYRDYYKTLGVQKDATAADLKKAYRKLARQYHPDVNRSTDASRKFKEVNEANSVLSDPDKRKKYDQLGPDWERYAQAGATAQGGRNGSGFQWAYTGTPGASPFEGESDFSEFFQSVFGSMGGFGQAAAGNGTRRRAARSRAVADAEYPIEATLAEAYKGAERVLELRGEDGNAKRLTVKIPAGVRDGQRIRLAGQAAGGDLYLQVKVKPHPLFTRDGDDLRLELPVALHEALLGAEVTVPTLKGRVSLRIPPETQNGRTIRLAGQGMPRAGGGHGDLYVTVKVVLPTKLNDKERELASELAAGRRTEDVRSHLL
ncbi:MAG TPA: molecular chaperone DnaJ [Chloroflexi bacterium]|jgi:curved DNA-binding protein|nr:molecular chaperone DnaJ [Chloroflexota bacterium]HAL28636.1 molecular chaperone DnaJ [Chloroflexota bacterium]